MDIIGLSGHRIGVISDAGGIIIGPKKNSFAIQNA